MTLPCLQDSRLLKSEEESVYNSLTTEMVPIMHWRSSTRRMSRLRWAININDNTYCAFNVQSTDSASFYCKVLKHSKNLSKIIVQLFMLMARNRVVNFIVIIFLNNRSFCFQIYWISINICFICIRSQVQRCDNTTEDSFLFIEERVEKLYQYKHRDINKTLKLGVPQNCDENLSLISTTQRDRRCLFTKLRRRTSKNG